MAEIDPELLKTIHRVQIRTTHLAENILTGSYHSAFKGKGLEFEEVREYIPGDDVRTIDWNVTARLGNTYVKNFREERELTVILAVDLSNSCRSGIADPSKERWLTEIAALIAFAATGNNDKVGLLTFTDKVQTYLAPKRGSKHVLRIIREIVTAPEHHQKTDVATALAFLAGVQRRRSICFIISDFLCDDFSTPLKLLASKHDVIAIALTDSYDRQFPKIGIANLIDSETGNEVNVNCQPNDLEPFQKQSVDTRLKAVETLMHKVNGGFIEIRSDQPYVELLNNFFLRRRQQR
jgi:uncharacterized protein (DUF58 family)